MGQGAIEYHGQLMLNCRESFLSTIGEALQRVTLEAPHRRFQPLAASWNRIVGEMPPGCSLIRLDEYLPDQETLESFGGALRAALRELGEDKPGSRELIQQLLVFLLEDYVRLEPVYRGKEAEQDAPPNSLGHGSLP